MEIAREVRIFEIASNEGLGLNNSKLINYVRQLERSKEEDKKNERRVYEIKYEGPSNNSDNEEQYEKTQEVRSRYDWGQDY